MSGNRRPWCSNSNVAEIEAGMDRAGQAWAGQGGPEQHGPGLGWAGLVSPLFSNAADIEADRGRVTA